MNLASLYFWILLLVWGVFFLRFYKKSSPLTIKTKDITIDAFFLGIIILMGAVPQLGYIQVLPWLSLTLMHLPVLIGAYLYGWKKGLLFGTAALGGLLFICIRVIREPYRRLYHTSSAVFRWLFVMPVLFYAGLFVLAYWPRSLLENKQNILPCVILILLIPASYLLEFALLNSERAKAEYEHRQSQLEAYVKGLERQNGNLQDCQLKSRIVRHDMRHFVGSLSVLLAEGRIAQAQEVLADITQSIDASKAEVYCENPIINSVLYGQLAQAKANHIAVTDSMDIPAQLGDAVNVTELAGVLANLLENAVNAVLHLPETERWLLLSAKCTDTQLIITMKNPYAGSLRLSPETGLPESAAGEEHGFGMRSIAAFAERYHAIFDFEAEGHIFKVHLLVRR